MMKEAGRVERREIRTILGPKTRKGRRSLPETAVDEIVSEIL
jgi:hypothetical protein